MILSKIWYFHRSWPHYFSWCFECPATFLYIASEYQTNSRRQLVPFAMEDTAHVVFPFRFVALYGPCRTWCPHFPQHQSPFSRGGDTLVFPSPKTPSTSLSVGTVLYGYFLLVFFELVYPRYPGNTSFLFRNRCTFHDLQYPNGFWQAFHIFSTRPFFLLTKYLSIEN